MTLTRFQPQPGLRPDRTAPTAEGYWRDGNLVRFADDNGVEPVGGWAKKVPDVLTGVPRAMKAWATLSGRPMVAFGTHSALMLLYGGALYDITPDDLVAGRASAVRLLGWGAGAWGRGTWGTPRATSGIIAPLRTWSIDAWGQIGIACPAGGSIYQIDPTLPGQPATVIPNAPTAELIVVDPQNVTLIAFGADGDPLKIQWPDRGSLTTWTPTATNRARDVQVRDGSRIVAALRSRGEILVWTDTALYSLAYQGGTYVYSLQRIGDADIIGPNAVCEVNGVVYWMGRQGFYAYNGAIQSIPNEIDRTVFEALDTLQAAKICAGPLGSRGEVWWFYPSTENDPGENDRYVALDTRRGLWMRGELDRTAWVDVGPASSLPTAASSTGSVYEHETGYDADGEELGAWVESGAVDMADGDRVVRVRRGVPDIRWTGTGTVNLTWLARMWPSEAATEHGPDAITPGTTKVDRRVTGRMLALRFEWAGTGFTARVNPIRLDSTVGGRR
ncbi:hypothetical protein [Azospirillum sp. ST 5-10]|uniref:hypothetical protein n=1 Tax=unclassified Azospirillum TaxID=2630922 RepID=UPI003F4A6B0B